MSLNNCGCRSSSSVSAGQFQQANITVSVLKDHLDQNGASAHGFLRLGAVNVPVSLQDKTLKDTVQKHHPAKCWVVPKAEVERLLAHPYQSYVVDRGSF